MWPGISSSRVDKFVGFLLETNFPAQCHESALVTLSSGEYGRPTKWSQKPWSCYSEVITLAIRWSKTKLLPWRSRLVAKRLDVQSQIWHILNHTTGWYNIPNHTRLWFILQLLRRTLQSGENGLLSRPTVCYSKDSRHFSFLSTFSCDLRIANENWW